MRDRRFVVMGGRNDLISIIHRIFGLEGRAITNLQINMDMNSSVTLDSTEYAKVDFEFLERLNEHSKVLSIRLEYERQPQTYGGEVW